MGTLGPAAQDFVSGVALNRLPVLSTPEQTVTRKVLSLSLELFSTSGKEGYCYRLGGSLVALGWKSSQTNVLCLKQKQGDYLEEGTKRLPCRQRRPSRGICTRPSGRV